MRTGASITRGRSRLAFIALAVASAAVYFACATARGAEPGTLDASFGNNGIVTVAVGSLAEASAVAVQPNGDIVTAGETVIDRQDEILSTRMTPDGDLDPSYGNGGIVTVPINGAAGVDSGDALALQTDGKIVIAGAGTPSGGGSVQFAAVRLNPDGSLDQSFGTGGVALAPLGSQSIANGIKVESDGTIALVGVATVNGQKQFAAAQLNPDGSLDQSFGQGGVTTFGPPGAAWGLAVQPEGRLVLVGETTSATGGQEFMVARLNSDGSVDQSFGQSGFTTFSVGSRSYGFAIALRTDGRIVVAGPALTDNVVAVTAILNPDGTLDQSYGDGGIATVPFPHGVNGIALDSDGRMVLPTVGAGVLRLRPDGTADPTFGQDGSTLIPIGGGGGANGIAIQPSDGKIVLTGAAPVDGRGELTVIRLNGGGGLSSSDPGTITAGAKRSRSAAVVQPKTPSLTTLHHRHQSRCRASHRHRRRHRVTHRRGAPLRHRAPPCHHR
jgi:uncharacterized delta-60 repeat protein